MQDIDEMEDFEIAKIKFKVIITNVKLKHE